MLVVSVLSIVNFVDNILTPFKFISTVNILPDVCAVVKLALTFDNVNARGILNLTLSFPAVNAEVSSLHATNISYGVFIDEYDN